MLPLDRRARRWRVQEEEIMAGLLRSAFRLRSCLLHVRAGRCLRTTAWSPAPLSSSQAAASRGGNTRHLLYQTRLFTVATEKKEVTQEQPVPAIQATRAQPFDWALNKLENSIRRTGRITKHIVLGIFREVCSSGNPSGNQALLLLRTCGLLLPEQTPAERTELAHTIWTKLKELGITYDISHYNALLKVYLENEHEFSPTEFLKKIEEANIQPNRVTYQRLIAACCNKGDIDSASNILSFMKSKDLPITESVFSALVTGHSRAGDMQNAENIISVMKSTGIEPGPDTYVALLNAYARKGDIDKIEKTLETLSKDGCCLTDKDLMDVIFTLAKAGYPQYVENILKNMRCDEHFIPDCMNLSLHLITHQLEDTAFQLLKPFFRLSLDAQNGTNIEHGGFLLQHCINLDMPIAKLKYICDKVKEINLHSAPLQSCLRWALQTNKTAQAFSLLKTMKEEGLPIRLHYFWPLLAWHQKEKNLQGAVEVLKVMHEMDVVADENTYSNYVLSHFDDDVSSAGRRLQEMGCPIGVKELSLGQIMYEGTEGRLDKVLAILSSPNMPAMDCTEFRRSLILGFKASNDVALWSKITELLYKDGRYCQTSSGPTESVGYFLYNLIDNMSDSEVQAKEEQLRQYFHQLKEMDIEITPNIFRGIQKLLISYDVHALIKDVAALTHRTDDWKVYRLKKLEELKAQDKPIEENLKLFIRTLFSEEDLEKALEVKAKFKSDLDVGSYCSLMRLCCRHDKAEEAMNLKEELSQKYPSAVMTSQSYLALVKVLAKCGQVDDAINILKEMKEKDVRMQDETAVSFFHILNGIALQGEVESVTRLHETIVSLGFSKPTAQLCGPLITVHLKKDDLSAALEAVMDCYKNYGVFPRFHLVLCKLVENGHTELLQKAVDFMSQERGEMMMLYELFFAFLITGKYKEAKKIIETQGLRAQPSRLQWFAEKCITNNLVDCLENMVQLTQNLFDCDRDEMYYYLLRSCQENNDWQKADAVWTKMQDENIIPRERTLRLLADILKSNNQEVPFDVPEMSPSSLTAAPDDLCPELIRLIRNKKEKEAFSILLDADKNNIVFPSHVYSDLTKGLLGNGYLENAMEVQKIAETHIKGFVLNDVASSRLIIAQVRRDYLKDAMLTFKKMVESGGVPTSLSVTQLVQALAEKGDLESIRTVEKMIKNLHKAINLPSMLFVSNTVLAHINSNNVDGAVEYLEHLFTSGEIQAKSSIAFVYRRLIDNKSETALERLSAMAERLANQFGIYRPATDLFVEYINGRRMEDARYLLQRCSAISEQKNILIGFLREAAKKAGQVHKIKALVDCVPDLDKNIVSFYLLKSYAKDMDVASAKALYEKMKEENFQPDELFLKRYAALLQEVGEPVPFNIPPESFKFYVEKIKKERKEYSSDED
ncbi:leucine-rich PPR motif-containing protein, mitochondrial isoform X3 [Pogona vitticeps]